MFTKYSVISIVLLALVAVNCSGTLRPGDSRASAVGKEPLGGRDADRYAVYNAVLSTYVNEGTQMLVISNRSPACEGQEHPAGKDGRAGEALNRQLERVRKEMPEAAEETLEDYRSNPAICLRPAFNFGVRYTLMGEDEYDRIFLSPGRNVVSAWREFNEKYPGSNGILSLSNVGFNRRMNQALVYVSLIRGGTDGVGRYFLLTRENGAWVVRKRIDVWYS